MDTQGANDYFLPLFMFPLCTKVCVFLAFGNCVQPQVPKSGVQHVTPFSAKIPPTWWVLCQFPHRMHLCGCNQRSLFLQPHPTAFLCLSINHGPLSPPFPKCRVVIHHREFTTPFRVKMTLGRLGGDNTQMLVQFTTKGSNNCHRIILFRCLYG